MKDKHITDILDSIPLSDLSESDLTQVRSHAARCSDCGRAYEAAQVSAVLLQERAAETFEPTPFFQTRVLAALRERQGQEKSVFKRMWEATGALVTSMAATVAALAALTFFVPGMQPTTTTPELATASSSYSADEVIFNQDQLSAEQMSYEQVLATLYESDEGAVK
jgi:hypothetical protein